jgi:molecular chaperone DnaK
MSTYYLGVDLGTTYTAAAVWREGRVEITNLGNRAAAVPSVVLSRQDGSLLVGEAAERRAAVEPGRVAREFKRRFGDPTPVVIGGTPYSVDALTARLLRWVVDKVTESEGGPPAGIAVSYPANWGAYKTDLLGQAIARADLDRVATVTEPEAAAIHYASQERIDPGVIVAVYDLGGGTFDTAVLRKTDTGWDILGQPQGIERLGGVDIDEAVFQHVRAALDGAVERLDPDEATALAAVARLRSECVEAKEALSSDTDVSIPVFLPDCQTEIRLNRRELETMIRPALDASIVALDRALRSAQVETRDVDAVLLVGGSSRVPLVAQLVSSELGRPVAIDAHPKYSVALGAAIVAADQDVDDAAGRSEVAPIPEPPSLAAAIPPARAVQGPFGGGPGFLPPPVPAGAAPPMGGTAALPAGGGAAAPVAPARERSKAGWVVLGVLLIGMAIGIPVVQATLLDGTSSGGTSSDGANSGGPSSSLTVPTISTTTPSTIFSLSDLSIGCSNGTMRDCDRLYEQLQGDPEAGDPLMESTVDTCGMADPAGGYQGTCEQELGAHVPGTVPTTAG